LNKYVKLFGDSVVYFIGNIGSKVISVLIVSFYSFMLTPGEFGKIDVVQTTIALILPFVTLCIHEAILRFCIKSDYSESQILSNGVAILCLSVFGCVPLCILLNAFHVITGNVFLIILLVVFEGFNTLLNQYCRGINKVKLFAAAGIVLTFVMAAASVVFLKCLSLGISGYFLSIIVGYAVSIAILSIGTKIFGKIDIRAVDKKLLRLMIKYSVPLIPNSIMWWLMNAADKYVILLLLGPDANGLYAIAGKIPMLLSTLTTVFMQAWQISAISESDSGDKNDFYSIIFNGLSFFLLLIVSVIFTVLKPVLSVMISPSYTDVWKYVPFLLLSSVFSCFSAFLGTNYSAMAKTGGALKTTLVGGVLNVILNFVFISFAGLNGAAIATAISFLVVWIMRIIDTKEFVAIRINIVKMLISFMLIITQVFAIYMFNKYINVAVGFAVIVTMILMNKTFVMRAVKLIMKRGSIRID